MNRVRKMVPIALLLVLAVAGVLYSIQNKATAPTDENQQASIAQKPDYGPVSYQGEEGKTAMAILKTRHQMVTKNYSFGEMVTAIDGVEPDNKHFWGFYINGSLAQVGADAYVTKASDRIEWKLEEIK